ncbi:glycoside hydrolase family 3 protein [Neglectibacter caecimuris]|uniref:glycoside hydrolase family 3 protein n=1 Tax=Neglectibacter caecimuris TaxID=3093658 RepID=UPI002AC9A361|nr:glycoside hydrolase family 3 C-terminal domain-containing protein [Neglectibacter sp. M00184]
MEHRKFDPKDYAAKARQTVAEGAVLLRNEKKTLPFSQGTKVAVFGRSQFNYYKSGTGSGGLVNTGPVPGIPEALEAGGSVVLDQELKAVYEAWLQDHPFDVGVGWAAEPWYQEEMPLEPSLVEQASGRNDAALVILGRTAGEDKDNSAAEGSFLLAQAERDMLKLVCAAFSRVAVVLNTGGILDMSWVEEYRPGAVLYVWQGGQEGGLGTADVLTGRAAPGGRLSDTIARDISDYPAAGNYGSDTRNVYAEDIYVGYRYFETFAPEKVLYPFGFGLSYTTFATELDPVSRSGDTLRFSATVKNTGDAPGREVVQFYCEAPQGKLGKAACSLCAFGKTALLQPGESQKLSLECPVSSLASYDDGGATGHRSCWVLEEGEYRFYGGGDVRSARPVGSVTLPETVVEQLEEACAPVTAFERLRPGELQDSVYRKAWEPVPLRTVAPMERRKKKLPPEQPCTGDQGWKLKDVADGKVSLSQFAAQLSDEDLCCMIRGEGMCSPKVTPGTAGAFGGVTDRLVEFGIPTGCCADGPSGIRMDCGTMAFSMPNGTCQACTFDPELVRDLYEYEGMELRKNRVDTLLGPGINLHRHPLNGRNFEYFSEDPFLTGIMAAAQLHGMQKYGVTGTIKHFACNSQEYKRNDVEAVVSERALRELYLKAFEIAVKEGGAYSIMTSYNPINGLWSASNYDLLTTILREQWGYTGQVMTDWWAKGNDEGQPGERTNTAAMVRSQNDLFMVTSGAAENAMHDNSAEGLAAGTVTRGEFLRSAENICRFLLRSPALLHLRGAETELDRELEASPSFDDGTASEIHYAEADASGQVTLDVSLIDLEKGKNTRFSVSVKERGLYTLKLTLRSTDQNDVSQMPLSIFQDRNLLGTFTLTGVERDWKTLELEVPAFSGNFYLRFFPAQTGLAIQSCTLELKKSLEEMMKAQIQ